METFAEDLFNVAEALNLDGFTLVGHSMGGATVTQFALDHQDRIKGLVLLNSTPAERPDVEERVGRRTEREFTQPGAAGWRYGV